MHVNLLRIRNFVLVASLFSFFIFIEVFVDSQQQSSNVDVLSVSTIPTCTQIFTSVTDQQQLCGPNTDTPVADVRLNININEQQAGGVSLVFKAFPFPGINATNTNPTYPCGSTPEGQNCSTLGSTLTVTWDVKPVVAAYQLIPIVSGVPLSYLANFSPLVVDVDDQDMEWSLFPGENQASDDDGDSCRCQWYDLFLNGTHLSDDVQCTKCPFVAAGAFIRGVNNPVCQTAGDIQMNPACGIAEVDTFCNCGGFFQECAEDASSCSGTWAKSGKTCDNDYPGTNKGIMPCLCFPYNPAPKDPTDDQINPYHNRLLKQGAMHQSNAHNYLDQTCGNGGALLADNENVLNFNNAAIAACRKMAYSIANANGIKTTQVEPFVQVNGPCYQWATGAGCGPPVTFDTSSAQNCPPNQECFITEFRKAVLVNPVTCMNQITFGTDKSCTTQITQQFTAHNVFNDIQDGTTCGNGIWDRFGANAPLGNKWIPNTLGTPNGLFEDICTVCRADYKESSYLPGLWGNQRKCMNWIQDWRECFLASYLNANAVDPGQTGANSPTIQQELASQAGFNYYTVQRPQPPGSAPATSQQFILQPVWCMGMLGKCTAATSGDTCWSSYNQPPDFFSNQYAPAQGPITTQGFETTPPEEPATGLNFPTLTRGLALTPYWISPAGSNPNFGDGGHTWRCGQGCDPEYSNSFSSTQDNFFPQQDPKAIGTVKGMTGLGPLCTAFEVALQGQVVTGVDLNFNYVDAQGNTQNQTMTLTTDNIGTGNSFNTLNDDGTGVYGRIIDSNSPSDQTVPLLGGVLVVCGTDGASTGAGALNGNLDVTNNGFSPINPWQNVVWLLQQVEKKYPGITGYFPGGCPVPIPTFITALQCFSQSTICSAPPDLCQAIYNRCFQLDNSVGTTDNCKSRGIIPFNIVLAAGPPQQFQAISPTQPNVPAQTCNVVNPGQANGVSWYYLPPQARPAFGPNFGQYGANPWTEFTDDATGQFICSNPSTLNQGVPGVPGVSSNTDVDPPCSIIGNLVRFHGQTSAYFNEIFSTISTNEFNNLQTICLSQEQQSLIAQNASVIEAASCSPDNFNAFSSSASIPSVGLPPNWLPNNPQMWVHQNLFLSSAPGITDMTLEVQLLISGFGLNMEVVNVENALFTNFNQFCSLLQNSLDGFANVSFINTGAQVAEYSITMTGCLDPTNNTKGDVSLQHPTVSGISAAPGVPTSVPISIPLSSLPGVKSLQCSFNLVPAANPNILLSQETLNCVVSSFLQTSGQGIVGIDGTIIPPVTSSFQQNACNSSPNPSWGCWLINGGWLAHAFFITFLIILAVCSIIIIVRVSQAGYFIQQRTINARKYNDVEVDIQTEKKATSQKTIQQAIQAATTKK